MNMTIPYLICSIVSFLMFLWLSITDVKRSLFQNIMILIMLITNLGYLSRNVSVNLSEALLAHKITYLGGCFLPLLYFLTVSEVCHIKMGRVLPSVLLLAQIGIFSLVCTIGYNDIYYKDVSMVVENNNVSIIHGYGPFYFAYLISMAIYLLLSILLVSRSIVRGRMVNRSGLIAMLVFLVLAIFCYSIQRLLSFKIDIMPITYIILMAGTLLPVYQSNMFTVEENKDIINEQISKVGFITFNRKMELMSCNEFSTNIFPELKKFKVGMNVKPETNELKNICDAVRIYDEKRRESNKLGHFHQKYTTFKLNDKFYESEIHTVNNFLGVTVGYTVEIEDETEHNMVVELTNKYNETLSKEVEEKTERIRTIQEKTILGMAQMVESRDLSTGGHIKRTSEVVRIFSRKLLNLNEALNENFLKLVERSAPMHDLGKIGVDDAILRKQGKFTDEEYKMMKTHAEIGGKMVRDILTGVEEEMFVSIATNVANYHHERYDGKGYPNGLSSTDIPLESRIMALADVFDALVSKRCYKEAFSYDKAFSIIEEGAGTQFDPELTKIFITCRKELEAYYDNQE